MSIARRDPRLHLPDDSPIVTIIWATDDGPWAETRSPGDSLADLPAKLRKTVREHWTPERMATEAARRAAADAEITLPRPERINEERARRLDAGTVLEVDGAAIAVTGADRLTLLELRLAGTDVTFRDAANVEHALTSGQATRLWARFRAWHEQIHRASWGIKAGEDEEVTRDELWTTGEQR